MAKKQIIATKWAHSLNKYTLPLLVVILFLAVIVQSLLIMYLFKLNQNVNNGAIANFIIQSVDNLNHPLPQDARTGTVYINEAGVTLPPPSNDLGIVLFSYARAEQDFKPILNLVHQNDVDNQKRRLLVRNIKHEEIFEAVPKLQACARGVAIMFNKDDVTQEAGSKVLSNGQTIYFSTEPLCMNDALLEYAKKIDSYN